MNKCWQAIGRIGFFVGWPLLYIYLRRGSRTRVLVVHGGEVLLVRGFFSGNDRWGLPGGGLHRGEQPAAGAARELFEETGIHLPPTRLTLLGEAIFRQYGLKFHYYQLAVELKQRPTVRAQKSEVAAVSWQPIVGIKSNDVNDDVVSTLAVWHDGRS